MCFHIFYMSYSLESIAQNISGHRSDFQLEHPRATWENIRQVTMGLKPTLN